MKAAPKLKRSDAAGLIGAAMRVDASYPRVMSPAYALSVEPIRYSSFLRCVRALDYYFPRVSVFGGTATMAPQFTRGQGVVALLLMAAIAEGEA